MPVTSLDVSIDGSFIQSCDVADNLLFFSTRTGERVTAEAVKPRIAPRRVRRANGRIDGAWQSQHHP